ncbi:MAG: hypothetical protein AAGF12_06325 [Myxococcota bacterium]
MEAIQERTPERNRELGLVRNAIASIGSAIIFVLVWIFGRRVEEAAVPWLVGPVGGDYIGDRPYEECAERESLSIERNASEGGLLPNMAELNSDVFQADTVHPEVRDFYEQTTQYRMDMWADTSFPANIALWLLVTTISRKVNQLNFPLRVLDTARGMDSEIVLLREPSGAVRYAGWYRRQIESQRVIYTGFYMTQAVPRTGRPCVKVVFPMPQGNATVILEPSVQENGDFQLLSAGAAFGDAGFYRINKLRGGRLSVWRVRSLKEHFRLYLDEKRTLRCDHSIRFLGLPVLHLHYRIERRTPRA